MPCKCWEVITCVPWKILRSCNSWVVTAQTSQQKCVPWKILRSCKVWVVTAQTSQQKYTCQEYTHAKETPHPHPSYSIVFILFSIYFHILQKWWLYHFWRLEYNFVNLSLFLSWKCYINHLPRRLFITCNWVVNITYRDIT